MKKPNLGKVLTSQVLTYPKFHLGGGHSISKNSQVQKVPSLGSSPLKTLRPFPKFRHFLILKAPEQNWIICFTGTVSIK